jgi:hypothetical protein
MLQKDCWSSRRLRDLQRAHATAEILHKLHNVCNAVKERQNSSLVYSRQSNKRSNRNHQYETIATFIRSFGGNYFHS